MILLKMSLVSRKQFRSIIEGKGLESLDREFRKFKQSLLKKKLSHGKNKFRIFRAGI
mgnify:FL=1